MNRKCFLAAIAQVFAVLILIMAATPQEARAQKKDCGNNCGECATGRLEGWSYNTEGDYIMKCLESTTVCARCNSGDAMVKDAPGTPTAILSKLQSLPLSSLAKLAPTLKGRILVHPGRGIVVVRGSSCNPDAVTAIAFLSRERIEILSRSGLPELAAFLDHVSH